MVTVGTKGSRLDTSLGTSLVEVFSCRQQTFDFRHPARAVSFYAGLFTETISFAVSRCLDNQDIIGAKAPWGLAELEVKSVDKSVIFKIMP